MRNGCEITTSFIINEFGGAYFVIDSIDAANCTNADGSIYGSMENFTAPYDLNYIDALGASTSIGTGLSDSSFTINNVVGGIGFVEVIDANGCITQLPVTVLVLNSGSITMTANVSAPGCGTATGSITLTIGGFTGSYDLDVITL